MAFTDLAPELIHYIYLSLPTISDVINLSMTCHRLHLLLRHSQKLPTLFAAAEREFGPIADIIQLLTYNSSQLAHTKRSPPQSYALLRQMIKIGGVAKKIQELYPSNRWQEDYTNRRALTGSEEFALRKAVYRYWLYCEAFQNKSCSRSHRLVPHAVEERCQLLRTWTTDELLEIEDLRLILEDLVSDEICPTDGAAQRSFNESCDFNDVRYSQFQKNRNLSWNSWPPDYYSSRQLLPSSHFHSFHNDHVYKQRTDLPVPQRRKLEMVGWGDDIAQYYIVESMMKLNPAQIMYLHEHVTNKQQVEMYVAGLGEEWFWNNGQTWLDTWSRVMLQRCLIPEEIDAKIRDGEAGITGGSVVKWLEEGEVCL